MNLHLIARNAINSIHPDEVCILYRSTGQYHSYGKLIPKYADGIQVTMQVQTEKESILTHSQEDMGITQETRKFWLNATDPPISGVDRLNVRGGDLIKRQDGTWWLVTTVVKDFLKIGWISVKCTRQLEPPKGCV
jgi:hypothetical protein